MFGKMVVIILNIPVKCVEMCVTGEIARLVCSVGRR